MKITENVFLIPGVVANPFLILDADGLTLIDAGMPRNEQKILAYVVSLGKQPRDIKRILLTHSDLDHVGSLAALHAATGARTYASQIEADAIALGKASRQIKRKGFSLRRTIFGLLAPFMKQRPFRVDEILKDGQVLTAVAGGLRVIDTSGHTPGHISLYASASGVLFCGDSMVSDEQGLHGSRPGLTWDEAKAKEAVKRQAALGARHRLPGPWPGRDRRLRQVPRVTCLRESWFDRPLNGCMRRNAVMSKADNQGHEIRQLARYQVRPEALTRCLDAIREFVAYVRLNEPGTLRYEVWQERDEPTRFVHSFVFRDAEADRIHSESAEVKKFAAVLYPECLAPVEFVDYELVVSNIEPQS